MKLGGGGFSTKIPAGTPSHSKQQALHWSPLQKFCKWLGTSVQWKPQRNSELQKPNWTLNWLARKEYKPKKTTDTHHKWCMGIRSGEISNPHHPPTTPSHPPTPPPCLLDVSHQKCKPLINTTPENRCKCLCLWNLHHPPLPHTHPLLPHGAMNGWGPQEECDRTCHIVQHSAGSSRPLRSTVETATEGWKGRLCKG